MWISLTLDTMIGEPGLVSTRCTAAMMRGSTSARSGTAGRARAAVGQRRTGARTLAGGVLQGQVVVEHEAELEGADHDQHQQRQEHAHLDQRLAARRGAAQVAAQATHHSTGSMRMALLAVKVKPEPLSVTSSASGVIQGWV